MADLQVLVVDDEPDIVLIASQLLEQSFPQFRVRRAESAPAAIALLDTLEGDTKVDLLLTDQRMPGGSGSDLIKDLKARGHARWAVMMTAYADIETAKEARDVAHADAFLAKPFDASALVETIRLVIGLDDDPANRERLEALFDETMLRLRERMNG